MGRTTKTLSILLGASSMVFGACASPKTQPIPTADQVPVVAKVDVPKVEPEPATSSAFQAVLRIDPKPGSKRFQGVWLETADGERLLVAYRARPWWKAFEDRAVTVTGERYRPPPEQQQIMVEHFDVQQLRVTAPTPEDGLISIGGKQSFTGTFRDKPAEPGAKVGRTRVFVAKDGHEYHLANAVESLAMDAPVSIKARPVEPSRFVARPGGDYLWIIDVSDAP